MTYDACDDERPWRVLCDCCHKKRFGCRDIEVDGESWCVCPRCAQFDDPRDAYIDPDYLRDARAEA